MRFLLILVLALSCLAQDSFHLRDGDRVVFYGDSITDQRLYTTFVETFALTRFPERKISFVHSGWGGDRVTGGGGGGIQQRLQRDILEYKPTVVTIMLGMNDGRYRAFDQQIFDIYASGYKGIVSRLKKELPGVRITAIQPSPFDDVTRTPTFEGGYNAVLRRYADFIKEYGGAESLVVADLNTPVVDALRRAKDANAELSQKILPDRVHPGPAGHLVMAAALLRAWNAPAYVSDVTLDAKERKVLTQDNTAVTDVQFGKSIRWIQMDKALPLPIDMSDAAMALAVNSTGLIDGLNTQRLRVESVQPGTYTLLIDGSEIGTFSDAELKSGVNLARLKTPMWAQANAVHALTLKHTNVHQARWRTLQTPFERDNLSGLQPALDALDKLESEIVERQRSMTRPKAHTYELRPGNTAFQPIFNGKDLSGWHISQVNHHGKTQAWKVENGVITGTQDKPGHGGILLTDRTYKNFEVQLDINPDYGCDSGLFLRSNEKGQAYQVLLDYLDGGAIGGIYGEGLKGVRGVAPDWRPYWKGGAWNHLRARIEGDVPRIQVWLNGTQITDWTDTENHLVDGATTGMIAVQVHLGNRWIPGEKHRFRNISVRELP